MKISELIVELQEISKYDGDLVVKVMDCNREFEPIDSVWISYGSEENFVYMME